MPSRLRKVRKYRGSRTHGWGQIAQHRGAGSRGGRGQTGGHKHGWTRTIVYEADRFGKNGFKRAWTSEEDAINVGTLDEIAEQLVTKNLAFEKDDGVHIDLNALDIGKLLGSGKIQRPLIIKVGSFSESAKRKIEEAKGRIVSEN